jgi:hypothetical protein
MSGLFDAAREAARGRMDVLFHGQRPYRSVEVHPTLCQCFPPPPVTVLECPLCRRPSAGQMERRRALRAEHLASLPPMTVETDRALRALAGERDR